ncbi:hypothetical protein TorRG33x02_279980 [Trema orientale]|uniref:Uncharacterized protein n=1 Tax=Trema orientale TaxID=63057 RepID=A0A2P5CMG7_TREOI|nr:hypothetical protein TorRG33x02_279980 [Trema orientale]
MAASSGGFEFNQFVFDAPSGEISSQMIKWNQKGNTTCQVLSWQHYLREKINCWWEHTKANELYHHHPSNEVAYNINKINTAAPCLALLFTLIRYHFVQAMVGLHKIILLVQKQLSCTAGAKILHANCKYVDHQRLERSDLSFRHGFLESSSKAKESTNDVVDVTAA